MEQSTIALIILFVSLVLYITPLIPCTMTAVLSMCAMVFAGILSPEKAFAGFGSASTILVAGMLIIGEACYASGFSDKIGRLLLRFTHIPKKWFVFIVYLFSAVLSIFMSGTAILAVFFPVLDAVASATNNRISRKDTYLAAGIGSTIGACPSIIGATSVFTGVSMLAKSESFGRMMTLFEPAPIGVPILLAGALFYATIGCTLQDKFFDFSDIRKSEVGEVQNLSGMADIPKPEQGSKRNTIMTGIVFCGAIIFWISGQFNIAMVAVIAAAILIVFKCVDERSVYSRISWETIIVVGASIGFANGISESGASILISDSFFHIFGFLQDTPFGTCALLALITTVISNFMSNTSAVVVMIPVAISLAQSFGADTNVVPFALAVLMSANISLSTPICTACVTMTLPAGYRAKDIMIVGGTLNVILYFVTIAAIKLFYFL